MHDNERILYANKNAHGITKKYFITALGTKTINRYLICKLNVVILDSMKSYLEQLTIQSENQKINLRKAFEWAGLSKTTYYRQLKGTELRYDTAIKIEKAIDQLATLQKK